MEMEEEKTVGISGNIYTVTEEGDTIHIEETDYTVPKDNIIHRNGTTYILTNVIDDGRARVFRPILTRRERERRMENIKRAAADMMRTIWKIQEEKEKEIRNEQK